MTPTAIGITGMSVLVFLLFSRMPVGFVMGFVGFLGFGWLISYHASIALMAKDLVTTFSSYDLSVMPLFVLMGQLAYEGGLAGNLYDAAYKFLGRQKGGLAMATIGASAFFGAICGSTNASSATMASVCEPSIKKYKYDPGFAAATVAAGGSLGILIPPSIIFIIYGIITETDIGKLFIAGIMPGIFLSILYIIGIVIYLRMKPELGPGGPSSTWKEKIISLRGIFDTLLLFLAIMGGLFFGLFTPTEGGAFGAFGVSVFLIVRRKMTWAVFRNAVSATARISCMVYIIAAGAIIFGHFFAVTRIPFDLATWIEELKVPRLVTMGLVLIGYLIGGCFMDSLAMILLTIPIFFPLVISMGYDPIWFGVIMVLIVQCGVITPPVGINVYVVEGVMKVPLDQIFRHILPFLFANILCILVLLWIPKLATWLPSFIR